MRYIKNDNFSIFALSIFFSVFLSAKSNSQTILEGGPFLGISWYNGDLNKERQFYNIHPAFGGLIRYSVNDRVGFKGSFIVGHISGEYPTKNVILLERYEPPYYEFKRTLSDIAIQLEINMFSFDHPYKKGSHFTPYMTFGVGTIFYKKYKVNKEVPSFALSLPFGAGVKWKTKNGLKFGAEWGLRKSFADDLDYTGYDNSINPEDPYGFNQWKSAHNNDWVSFVGAYISVTLLNRREKCKGLDFE
jgi:hypothetical protein